MKNDRLVVALDIDGVVCDLHSAILERINRQHKLELTLNDICDWDWTIVYEGSVPVMFNDVVREVLDDYKFTLNLPVVEGAKEVVDTLLDNGINILFLTSRREKSADVTREWVTRNFGRLEVKHSLNGKMEPSFDVLVDDRAKFLENFAKVCDDHAFGVLLSRPWNRGYDVSSKSRIVRISDWPSVGNLLLAVSKMDNYRRERKW